MSIKPADTMTYDELRTHMIDDHGWPTERIDEAKLVDVMDASKGTCALTEDELLTKHDGEDWLGPKFTAHHAHTHGK